jgi:hypothetical protein
VRRRILSLSGAMAVAVALLACGAEDGIGQTASLALSPHVEDVRLTATAGDRDGALAALAALRREVAELRTTGELSGRGAATVLEAALDVEQQVARLPARLPGPLPAPPQAGGGASGRPTTPGADEARKIAEEARKQAEEAAKKAEEEAKKAAEEAKKRAEDAKKRAEEMGED